MKNQLKDFYPNISADKISMLYNPFDIKGMQCESKKIELLNDFEKGLISDDYICTVTRLDEHQKDVTTLIKAYHLLFARNNIKEKLYIIGDGPSYSELNKLISKLKLEKQILLIGSSATPLVWMDNAKVFVLSSKYEGLPSVIIEAMSVKTFVISSKCKTGPAEMLGDGYYGELFDVGNVEQLADSIYKALNDVSYRDTKVARASDRVNVFDVNTIANNFLKMLQSL
jgi:glycosyltransferase involved in cell wall biosynthesis